MALGFLDVGLEPDEALENLAKADSQWQKRQVLMVDRDGVAAAHTGSATVGFAGHVVDANVACGANMMRNDGVPAAMLESWHAGEDLDLVDRLVRALQAAEARGGDIRGRMSSALLVVDIDFEDPVFDLRVDHDRNDPNDELAKLVVLEKAYLHARNGNRLLDGGDPLSALHEYRKAVELYPTQSEFVLSCAVLEAMAGDVDVAVATSQRAYAMNPDLRDYLHRMVAVGMIELDAGIVTRITR